MDANGIRREEKKTNLLIERVKYNLRYLEQSKFVVWVSRFKSLGRRVGEIGRGRNDLKLEAISTLDPRPKLLLRNSLLLSTITHHHCPLFSARLCFNTTATSNGSNSSSLPLSLWMAFLVAASLQITNGLPPAQRKAQRSFVLGLPRSYPTSN